jgi:flagellar protein FliL
MMRYQLRPGKTLVLLLVACGLVSAGIGAGLGIFITRRAHAAGPGKKASKRAPARQAEVKTVHSLGEMVVNLADAQTLRYVKATIALGIEQSVSAEGMKEYEPPLRDAVLGVLTDKRFVDLHRKGGLRSLKKELLAATRHRLKDVTVSEIYVEAFAMQ